MGEPASKATPEEVWAAIKATEEARLKGEKSLRESQGKTEESLRLAQEEGRRTQKEVRELVKAQQKTEKAQQKTEEAQQKTEEELQILAKSLNEANGNFNNKWGHFLENFLEGDLVKLLNKWDIPVDRILPNLVVKKSGVVVAEYDLVAVNGVEIVVVEVKTTLEKDHVGRFIKKLKDFKNKCPEYGEKTLYGAVAYMSIKRPDKSKEFEQYSNASEMAEKKGLFLIKSPSGVKDMSTIANKKGFRPTEF